MRKALLVGIDDYAPVPLKGCVADATRMSTLLRQHYNKKKNFDCDPLLLSPPTRITRPLLRKALRDLWATETDVTLFYFAGHGRLTDLGGYLVTCDDAGDDDGVPMRDVLTLANKSKCREAIIILDCCHSGAIGLTDADHSGAVLRDGVSILGAAHEREAAGVGTGGRGLFTSLMCEALSGGAADVRGRVTAASMYAFADQILGAWHQRPVFRSQLATVTSLRDCEPTLPLEMLLALPTYFATADEDFPLDPSYEPELEPHDEEHERIFAEFRNYLMAGLLVPVGEKYMYHAALYSKACRLTPLGRFYWELAKRGRL